MYYQNRIIMRIINKQNNQELHDLILLLTKNEVNELIGSLQELVENPLNSDHVHLNDEDYSRELIVCIYDPIGDLSMFQKDVIQIIKSD